MSSYTVKKTITLSEEEISDIMSSALQGITYWADEAYVQGKLAPKDEGIYTSDALTKGYRIRIHDVEAEKWHILTIKKFMNGIKLMPSHNFDYWDMYDADRVIQLAIFGKQVYA